MKNMTEELNKSIDALIDELFVDENVEKSLDIAKDSKSKADEVVNQAPKFAKDVRSVKEIHDVPQVDQDGSSAKDYDSSISEKAKEEDQAEADQVKEMNQIKEGGRSKPTSQAPKMAPFKKAFEVSEDEYKEFQELKKSQVAAKVEELKKAEETKMNDLIKSVIEKTSARYESKINELSKSLNESNELVKSMAKQPQRAKSITNIEALEKSLDGSGKPQQEFFTKSELLDAAEELVEKGQLNIDHVIELENNGFIYNPTARKTLESYIGRKK